jgi:hypothetical protein
MLLRGKGEPAIEPMTFKTRAQARDRCREHFRGSPIREEGPGGTTKRRARPRLRKTARRLRSMGAAGEGRLVY